MGKKIQKTIGTLLLVVAIAVTQIPVSGAWATTALASDFQLEGTTLVKYTGTAATVSVPDTVKTIGSEAFSGNDKLDTVTLPDGLQTIEFGAFLGCSALKELKISTDNPSFTYEAGVLYNKGKTEIIQALAGNVAGDYNMPSSINKIAPYAFSGCVGLQTLTINSGLKEIPERAFSNCKNLKEATIPASVSSIHETAFEGCFNLKITAPEGSVAAEYAKKRDTSDVAQREYEDVSQAEYQNDEYMQQLIQKILAENNLPGSSLEDNSQDNVQSSTAEGAFSTLSSTTDGTIPQNESDQLGQTSVVGSNAVVFIDNTKEQVISGSNTVQDLVQENESVSATDAAKNEDSSAISGSDSVSQNGEGQNTESQSDSVNENISDKKSVQFPKYTLVDDKIVANQAFYKDGELTEYEILEGVTQIGDFAFSRSGLKAIVIPEGVTDIGYGAFYHCDNLESISIPSTVVNIKPSAFEKTKWLNSWMARSNTEDYNIIGDGILIAYKGKESSIAIPEGIKQIAPGVFKEHMGITKISLPSSLLRIGEEAFSGCSNLKEVTGGGNLEEIRDRAFAGCPIENVRIQEKVHSIGLGAFNETGTTRKTEVTPVVFMGKELPKVSYEDTSTRLSNAGYRNLCFDGITVAIVDPSIDTFEDTILAKDSFGFRGLVCSVVQESDGKKAGLLEIKQCTIIPDEKGSIVLPKSVNIYGKKYEFVDIEATKTIMNAEKSTETSEENAIKVQVNSEILKDTNTISAILPGSTKEYTLTIKDSESAKEILDKAYRTIYGEKGETQINAFDISLYDLNGTIPIKKIGKETITITVPFPNNITGNPQVVCTDENGQLERVESSVVKVNGTNCIEFKAKHFSPYGIYTYGGNSAVVNQGNAIFINSMRQRDASPDTGDLIHPKWILAMGLFALSMMFFLWKKPKDIKISK